MEGTRILDEKRSKDGKRAPAPPRHAPAPPAAAPAPPSKPPAAQHVSYEPAKEEFRTRIEKEEPRREITALKSMFDELRFPTATAEVTLLILRYASEVVNRAVLFMVKKTTKWRVGAVRHRAEGKIGGPGGEKHQAPAGQAVGVPHGGRDPPHLYRAARNE